MAECDHDWRDCKVDINGIKAESGRSCSKCDRIEFQLEEPYDELFRGYEMTFSFDRQIPRPGPRPPEADRVKSIAELFEIPVDLIGNVPTYEEAVRAGKAALDFGSGRTFTHSISGPIGQAEYDSWLDGITAKPPAPCVEGEHDFKSKTGVDGRVIVSTSLCQKCGAFVVHDTVDLDAI